MISIGRRLLVASLLVLGLFLGLTGLALERAFANSVRAGLYDRLRTEIYALLAVADVARDGTLVMPRRLRQPRLETSGAGLYAEVIGAGGKTLWRSRSMVGTNPAFPAAARVGVPLAAEVAGRNGKFLGVALSVEWELEDGGVLPLQFRVAETKRTESIQVASFRKTLLGWLGGAGLLLLSIQWLVVRWGLGPLRRAAGEMARVEAGRQQTLGDEYPHEIAQFTRIVNRFIHTERARVARYRSSLADLAHRLKTPLAVVRNQTTTLTAADRQVIAPEVERMEQIIYHELGRASAVGSRGIAVPPSIKKCVDRILASLDRVHAEKKVIVDQAVDERARFVGEEEDLLELLGTLLDNAYKWCAGRVTIQAFNRSVTDGSSQLVIEVADDGPGIPPNMSEAVLQRGVRLDPDAARQGQGIGLAVAKEIVEAHGGRLGIASNRGGGTRVLVEIPWPAGRPKGLGS